MSSIGKLLKKFSVEELVTDVINLALPGITQEQVLKEAERLRLSINSNDIGSLIVALYESTNPSKEDLKDAACKLIMLDSMKHKNRNWKCVRLLGDGSDAVRALITDAQQQHDEEEEKSPPEIVADDIIRAHNHVGLNSEIIMMCDNDIVWYMVLVGRSQGKMYALSRDQGRGGTCPMHIFVSGQPTHQLLQIVVNALGFDEYKFIKLEGGDVPGMFRMLATKHSRTQLQPTTYCSLPFLSIDSCLKLSEARRKYADSFFTGKCTLQHLTIESTSRWRGPLSLVGLGSDTEDITGSVPLPPVFKMKLIVRSRSKKQTVEDVLKQMMEIGMMNIPPPDYIKRLAIAPPPTNSIKIIEPDLDG